MHALRNKNSGATRTPESRILICRIVYEQQAAGRKLDSTTKVVNRTA